MNEGKVLTLTNRILKFWRPYEWLTDRKGTALSEVENALMRKRRKGYDRLKMKM